MITVTPAAQRLRSQYAAGHPTTADLDRLVGYYTELLGAALAFERAATGSDRRVAAVDVGGDVHLMIVETGTAPSTDLDPLDNAGRGLRVGTRARLCGVRGRILDSGARSDRSRHFPRSGR
ncbi:hypothetical protein ACFU5D_17105 [Streptomyces anthocyanicus]|uniref:hypothetical protein n=1 Tax=Streptomyces anthocyanicus TaxID=68174 RepID=UPI0036B20AB5